MSALKIKTAAVFEPLLYPSRYKGAHGGRGSGKSHFFGGHLVEEALLNKGQRAICIREVQKSLKESAKRLIEDKISEYGLTERDGFKVFREVIETPGDGLIAFQGMQDHTADSVKSLEGFTRCWVEEAQTLSSRSMELLLPTIRAENSEIWFSWNPNRPTDAVEKLLRGDKVPHGATVVQANWNTNPWFPKVLEQERLHSKETDPDRYGHIWEGEYARVFEGAYFASHLEAAERESRIGNYEADPIIGKLAYWDIGGTGQKADATAIWIAQRIGAELRVLDYYEAQGQPFDTHVGWLKASGHDKAHCVLPHDGRNHDKVYKVTPQSFLRDAGFRVRVRENIGAGAAMKRVSAARRVFPNVRFDRKRTKAGREALAWYHERRDEVRQTGLGPEHDWASHGADAFGEMCVDYLASGEVGKRKPIRRNLKGVV